MINKSVCPCNAILIALVANRFRAHKKEYGIPVWRWQVCYSFRFPDSLMFPSQRASLRPGYSHREAFELSELCNNTWGGSWLTGGRGSGSGRERERERVWKWATSKQATCYWPYTRIARCPHKDTRYNACVEPKSLSLLENAWAYLSHSLSLYLCGTGIARRAL